MQAMKSTRWVVLFSAVTLFVLAQVAWWATLFVREVRTVEALRLTNRALAEKLGEKTLLNERNTPEAIAKEAALRKVMFLSETGFFGIMTCFGLFLIYHAVRAEMRSREIQKNFIEIVSHESKTPLTALKLRLESALDKWRADAALGRELGLALEEVRRLSSVFEKVMTLNRVEREAYRFELLELGETVQGVLRRLEPFFRSKGATVSLERGGEVFVNGDAHGIANVLQSLLENAVLYNDKAEKKLSVTVKEEYSVAVLTVSDNGPGIPAEERARIFERFYRGGGGRNVPGTGLGLYIARSIVEAHQGSIRIADTGGDGTRFEIVLPAVKA